MTRNSFWMLALATFCLMPAVAAAGPSDLLKQAIREDEDKNRDSLISTDDTEAANLTRKGDRFIESGEFTKAVALFEKAYRLNPKSRTLYARLLTAKRAAGRMTEQDREALTLIEAEQAAEVNQVFCRVRLRILQARQALREGDGTLASEQVSAARASLGMLPRNVDTSPYERELDKIADSLARKEAKARRQSPAQSDVTVHGSNLAITRKKGRSAATLTLDDIGEPAPSTSGAASISETEHSRYVETGDIVHVDEAMYGDQATHAYERELAWALAHRRAEHLINNQAAAFPPPTDADLVYPDDWAARTTRRSENRDGVIHQGASFQGPDGETYETVIYDLAELVHPVPNFYAAYPGTVREQRMQSLDRQYLRERSMIFNGWPEDLAAGLPLLHFFGGIDNNAVSTRTDPYETDRIVQTLERFINSSSAPAPTSQNGLK